MSSFSQLFLPVSAEFHSAEGSAGHREDGGRESQCYNERSLVQEEEASFSSNLRNSR